MPTLQAAIESKKATEGAQVFGRAIKSIENSASDGQRELTGLDKSINGLGQRMSFIASGALMRFGSALAAAFSFKKIIEESMTAERSFTLLDAALKSVGMTASPLRDRILSLSESLMHLTGVEDEQFQSAAAMLLQFENISDKIFPKVIKLSADLAARMGGDTTSAALSLGRALNSPEDAMRALVSAGLYLTKSQKDLIESFIKTGDVIKAQNVILAELEKRVGGAAEACNKDLKGAFGNLKTSIGELAESFGNELNPSLKESIELMIKFTDKLNRENIGQKASGFFTDVGFTLKQMWEESPMSKIFESPTLNLDFTRKKPESLDYGFPKPLELSETKPEIGAKSFVGLRTSEQINADAKALLAEAAATKAVVEAKELLAKKIAAEAEVRKKVQESLAEYLEDIQTETKLMGMNDEERELATMLLRAEKIAKEGNIELTEKYIQQLTEQWNLQRQLREQATLTKKTQTEQMTEMKDDMEELANISQVVGDEFGRTFEDIVLSAGSATDAIKAMVQDIGRAVFHQLVTLQIAKLITGAISGWMTPGASTGTSYPGTGVGAGGPTMFTAAMGGAWDMGGIRKFQRGGIVNSPTMFPMGMMGESGAEAIMPLKRTPSGELGVKTTGAQTIIFNINTPNIDSFRKSKKQIINDIRRVAMGRG